MSPQRLAQKPQLRYELGSLSSTTPQPDHDAACNSSDAGGKNLAKTIRVAPLDPVDSRQADHYLGKILDQKYQLERLLGKGGMGAVYLSTHLGTGRQVAVKLISPEFMRTADLVERFKREARAAGHFRHSNIIDVTDFGIAAVDGEQIAYLVMEYLNGCTLSDVLAEEHQLPLDWVVDVMEQTCAAVNAAHQRGIIHRDLKPANIWLEPNGLGSYRVKVLDFGIAKIAQEPDLPSGVDSHAAPTPSALNPRKAHTNDPESLTQAGMIIGTPAYMSPEQCRGEPADKRSDVYSLGLIAYELLSGSTPFNGVAGSMVRAQIEETPKPLHQMRPKVSRAVSSVVMKALEKSPEERPQSAREFGLILKASASGLGALFRRAFAVYSEYFSKITQLSLLAHLPVFLWSGISFALTHALLAPGEKPSLWMELALGFGKNFATFLTGSTIAGLVAIIVVKLSLMPLRPVSVAATFRVLFKCWRPFFKTGLVASLVSVVGFALLVVPGAILTVLHSFWGPVVLTEGLQTRSALRRSRELAARSYNSTIAAVLFQILIPLSVGYVLERCVPPANFGRGWVRALVSEISTFSSVFVLPLPAILIALVFLKLRQLGGQDLSDVTEQMTESGSETVWERATPAPERPEPQR